MLVSCVTVLFLARFPHVWATELLFSFYEESPLYYLCDEGNTIINIVISSFSNRLTLMTFLSLQLYGINRYG
jgi:hypothetical protein